MQRASCQYNSEHPARIPTTHHDDEFFFFLLLFFFLQPHTRTESRPTQPGLSDVALPYQCPDTSLPLTNPLPRDRADRADVQGVSGRGCIDRVAGRGRPGSLACGEGSIRCLQLPISHGARRWRQGHKAPILPHATAAILTTSKIRYDGGEGLRLQSDRPRPLRRPSRGDCGTIAPLLGWEFRGAVVRRRLVRSRRVGDKGGGRCCIWCHCQTVHAGSVL
jgi:hypothetical protein